MYLVIVVCCTNLSLTWERAKRGVRELEELLGKKQFKAWGSAWDRWHSSVVFFGAVSSCCKSCGFGGLHTHAPPSFGNSPVLWAYQLSSQKHFLFFSPHDHRKMVANVTLQAQKPNRKYSSQLEIYLMINIGADLPIYTTWKADLNNL